MATGQLCSALTCELGPTVNETPEHDRGTDLSPLSSTILMSPLGRRSMTWSSARMNVVREANAGWTPSDEGCSGSRARAASALTPSRGAEQKLCLRAWMWMPLGRSWCERGSGCLCGDR